MKAAAQFAAGRLDAEGCWRAVLARDAQRDGAFVFAVRSTGIYCRPSCPSRRPRREHVLFFDVPDAAEREGFRACRRCRPRDANGHAQLVRRVCAQIQTRPDEPPRLAKLAAAAGISLHHLQRTFRRALGVTPRQYADALRVGRLKRRLQGGDDVTTALYEAGYGSSSRLYENAGAQLGMTPATYRRGGRGMHIGFTVVDCPLGRLLVAATSRGVSAVYLGATDAPLVAALKKEYPAAEISRATNGFEPWVRSIVRHLEGREPRLDLPTDVQATAFQRLVWETLRKIPYGATRTYSRIARELGRPRATRAVARACATNPVSIVVPCHRVVREDGGLGGYRWGLERKQALLEHEKSAGMKPRAASAAPTN